jgi:triosephosphate isomerase
MRKKIVAGNWKMNLDLEEGVSLIKELNEEVEKGKEVVVCTPFIHLERAVSIAAPHLKIGAQNVSQFAKGAYTGEISAAMLSSLKLKYCIVGHSERRQYFQETNKMVQEKVEQLLEHGITPIVCCGESLEAREAGSFFEVIKQQLQSLLRMKKDQFHKLVLAYEPVWAIGTGETASPEQAQEVHRYIRETVTEKFDQTTADQLTILYGGSCKPDNAADLFSQPDIDGGLIGGASLKASDFAAIVNAL